MNVKSDFPIVFSLNLLLNFAQNSGIKKEKARHNIIMNTAIHLFNGNIAIKDIIADNKVNQYEYLDLANSI